MIVAERKPIEEILEMLEGRKKILVLGCGGCVSVCLTGGEKEAETLASQLRMKAGADGIERSVEHAALTRQCDLEFVEELSEKAADYDAILSMACGAGVQLLTDRYYEETLVLPAMNTTFLGANTAPGVWTENCRGCGQCMLALTGGICPMSRCAKSLTNGPCGGTDQGHCEVDPDTDCAWHLIYERLRAVGRLDLLKVLRDPVQWSRTSDGTRRRLVRAEMTEEEAEEATGASSR